MAAQVKGLATKDTKAASPAVAGVTANAGEDPAVDAPAPAEEVSEEEARKNAREAYLRAWPLDAEETR